MDLSTFQQRLLEHLDTVTDLQALVHGRIFFANYNTLPPIAYPAITFQNFEGHGFQGIYTDFPQEVIAHSDRHFDEAHEVMDALTRALDFLYRTGASVLRVTGNPTENYLVDPRLHQVACPVHAWLL